MRSVASEEPLEDDDLRALRRDTDPICAFASLRRRLVRIPRRQDRRRETGLPTPVSRRSHGSESEAATGQRVSSTARGRSSGGSWGVEHIGGGTIPTTKNDAP